MAEKKELKDTNPPQKVQKSLKLVHAHTNVSYSFRTLVTFKNHP